MAERVPTTEKLAAALEQAGAPAVMIEQARQGYYDDYRSPLPTPIMALVVMAESLGLADIARRAKAGEFDGQRWETEAWAKSPEGQAVARQFFGGRSRPRGRRGGHKRRRGQG